MKRILLMAIRNIFLLPSMWIRLCYHAAHLNKFTEEEHYTLLKKIVQRANKAGNVTIEPYGIENLPKQNGYMLFPNHQGLYDVLAIINASPNPLSVVAKKEVGNIPFLKQVFGCMRAFLIDRDDIRQGLQVINDVTTEVLKGRNYLIFPEGTRSKRGNTMREFKGGSFKAATKARCPIIPVALIDSFKPFDANSIQKVTVQVHFLKPLYYEEYKSMRTTEISKTVQLRIYDVIKEYTQEEQETK